MIQLQDIYDSFTRYKQDITDVETDEFVEWCQFVAYFVYDKTKGVAPDRYVLKQQYSVVLPPQTETLPTDFMDMKQTNCGLYPYDTRKRLVATFDSTGDTGITFSDSGGTSAYNSNIKVQGGSSRGFSSDAAATLILSWSTNIDWEDFDDGGADSPDNDYISIYAYVGNSVPTSATIAFSTNSDGSDVGSEEFSSTYSSLVAGWNHIKVLKSAFTSTGSPAWSSLGYLTLAYTGGGTDTNFYWDKLELVENSVNGNDELDDKLGVTNYGSKKEGYYLDAGNVVFTSAVNIEDKDYVMAYMPQPPTFVDLDSYFSIDLTETGIAIVEDRHLEYLVKAVDVLYEQWDRDVGAESVSDFRMVRALGEVLSSINRVPQVSTMYNPANDA